MKARQMNSRSEEPFTFVPSSHPASFALSSLKSRAAARAMLERHPKAIPAFGLGDSPRPKFV
jgi:hypothetical protein